MAKTEASKAQSSTSAKADSAVAKKPEADKTVAKKPAVKAAAEPVRQAQAEPKAEKDLSVKASAPAEIPVESVVEPSVDTKPTVVVAKTTKPEPAVKQRIRIRLKAYDHKVIDQSTKQIVDVALRTGATIAGPIPLPTKKTIYTVVKSPHVFKKGREQFEMRVHKRLIDVYEPTPKTIDSLMNLSLPAGCDAEIKM